MKELLQLNPQPTRRAIIVDDEPAVCEVLSKILSSLGCDVMVATQAKSNYVLDLADSDLIFLDVLMPGTSGLQVMDQLAHQGSKSPLVLMSGNLENLEGAEKYAMSLELNLVGVLDKPFRLADVQDVLSGT